MDIQLKGKTTGIDVAHAIRKYLDIPLIYLTANADDATFLKARETQPYAFISKPFTNLNLERTIALVEEKIKAGAGLRGGHLCGFSGGSDFYPKQQQADQSDVRRYPLCGSGSELLQNHNRSANLSGRKSTK